VISLDDYLHLTLPAARYFARDVTLHVRQYRSRTKLE